MICNCLKSEDIHLRIGLAQIIQTNIEDVTGRGGQRPREYDKSLVNGGGGRRPEGWSIGHSLSVIFINSSSDTNIPSPPSLPQSLSNKKTSKHQKNLKNM